MDDQAAFMAAIAANPRDLNAHFAYADWLEERPEAWRRTEEECSECAWAGHQNRRYCKECPGTGRVIIDRTDWPFHRTPIYEHRVLWPLALQWEDERWHGEEEFGVPDKEKMRYDEMIGKHPMFPPIRMTKRPTFSLLLDRPGDEPCEKCGGRGQVETAYEVDGVLFVSQKVMDELKRKSARDTLSGLAMQRVRVSNEIGKSACKACSGSGKQAILGHLSELVAVMREHGDPRAEELGKLKITTAIDFDIPTQGYDVGEHFFSSRLDALRELRRRVWRTLTEECSGSQCKQQCQLCHGLGWKVRSAGSPAPFPS